VLHVRLVQVLRLHGQERGRERARREKEQRERERVIRETEKGRETVVTSVGKERGTGRSARYSSSGGSVGGIQGAMIG
jgi:hypothetical protein